MSAEQPLRYFKTALGWQIIRESAVGLSLLLRDEAVEYSLEEIKRLGWTKLTWVHYEALERGSDHGVVVYLLAGASDNDVLEVQVLKLARNQWPSASGIFEEAAALESDCSRRTGIIFEDA